MSRHNLHPPPVHYALAPRALLPRCRACDRHTFGAAHKAVTVLLAAAALALLIGGVFSSLPNL